MKIDRRKFCKYAATGSIATIGFPILRRGGLARASTSPPFLLSIRIQGGWDPTMVFDPKIGTSSIAQESGWEIANITDKLAIVSHSSRPSVNDFFENHAENVAIINGIDCKGIEHLPAFDASYAVTLPTAHHRGDDRKADPAVIYPVQINPGLLAPHLNIGCRSVAGAYLSYSHQLNDASILRYATGSNSQSSRFSTNSDDVLKGHLNSRYAQTIGEFPSLGLDSEKIDSLARNYSRDQFFYENLPEVIAAIGSPTTSLRRNALIALEMMARGFTYAASIGDQNFYGWDTHVNHFTRQSVRFEALFSDLNVILTYANALGISDRLILTVSSDVGRSPFLNAAMGKDHWSYSSAMIYSAAITGNQVFGLTDGTLRSRKIDPSTGNADEKNGIIPKLAHVFATTFAIAELSTAETFAGDVALTKLVTDE